MGIDVWQRPEPGGAEPLWLSADACADARRAISSWDFYKPSPIRSLDFLADAAGARQVFAIDESQRAPLKSFKMLGAVYAVGCAVVHRSNGETNIKHVFTDAASGKLAERLRGMRVVAATDGNHGRALAWASKKLGIECSIYMPSNVSPGREMSIQQFGATTTRVAGTYDEAVARAYADAVENDWIIIQDTALPGFEIYCYDIMCGYTLLAHEAIEQMAGIHPTHVFVQAGVGGLAAAAASYMAHRFGNDRPTVVVVESDLANCVLKSLQQQTLTAVPGPHSTMMAGIACGETSAIAWQTLRHATDFAVSFDDDLAKQAMRYCAEEDPELEIGETGIAGLAVMYSSARNADLRATLDIDKDSVMLGFITEGITDPETYRSFLEG